MGNDCVMRLDLDLSDSLGRRIFPDAVVMAEDRYLGLGSLPAVDLDPRNELDAAYIAIRKERPLPLGRYLLLRPAMGRERWIYQAVVHDLDHAPSVRRGDVRRALLAIVQDGVSRGFTSLACEPLGVAKPGGLDLNQLAEAVDEAIEELCSTSGQLPRLTLLLDQLEQIEQVSSMLRSLILRRARRNLRVVGGDSVVVELGGCDQRLHVRFVPGSLSGYVIYRAGKTIDASGARQTGHINPGGPSHSPCTTTDSDGMSSRPE